MNNWPSFFLLLFSHITNDICINESHIADPTTKTSLPTKGPEQNLSRQLRDQEQAEIPPIHAVTSQQWKQQYQKSTTRESESTTHQTRRWLCAHQGSFRSGEGRIKTSRLPNSLHRNAPRDGGVKLALLSYPARVVESPSCTGTSIARCRCLPAQAPSGHLGRARP